ncbi:protein FAM160B1-like [Elysia marginata]|uniref:Protein FAM160B1-like n=1 Tax=Elysia marginata TaxID=1093978 RepID=A0AAV4IDM8_9GAST|nr:protein FAM160B1-like [Elysia marginata]
MFHKFTNFIQQTVDVFSPNIAPHEEFVYHWKSVTSYFLDNKDGGVRIEETALPEHLMAMLRILQEEESNYGEAGTTGACLEYLLQHRLLETLYTLGRTDHPPGMKQLVLSFFTKALSRISHPLLPHINVHRAIQRMVKACGESRAAPTEKEEIEFLCTVCAKIKTDPYLVNFFIESLKKPSDAGVVNPTPQTAQTFSLVDALLTLSHSEFKLSPLMLVMYVLRFDDILERNEQNTFPGKQRLISFLSWLDYCDQLIAVSNPAVGEALAAEIHKQLLTDHFLAQLMQPSESGAIVATFYVNRCLRTVNSPALLKEFCHFLLGEDRGVELKEGSHHHPLHKRLIERCNHVSEEASPKEAQNAGDKSDLDSGGTSSSNLQQHEKLEDDKTSQEPSEALPDSSDVVNCDQQKPAAEESSVNETAGPAAHEEHLQQQVDNKETSDTSKSEKESRAGATKESALLFGRSEVHKVVNCFLSLLPEEAKSSYQTADTGYDMYLRDAHKQFSIQETVCRPWGWPRLPLDENDFKTSPFYEGSFLHMLMDKLWHLLDQSYSVNLLLTALISRVALVPHPNLHEFLLEPFLPTKSGTRTLYSVLSKVANDIKHHQNTDSTFFQKLLMARKQLLGMVPTIHRFEDQGRMEAIIVLEEFCKELSAITFVKHHAAVTRV